MKYLCVCILFLAILSMAQKPGFCVRAELLRNHEFFAPGETIRFRFHTQAKPGYSVHGWKVILYLRKAPDGIAEKLHMEVHGEDLRYQVIELTPQRWEKNPGEGFVNTSERWPEGDYSATISLLFRRDAHPSVTDDVYAGTFLSFTLEK